MPPCRLPGWLSVSVVAFLVAGCSGSSSVPGPIDASQVPASGATSASTMPSADGHATAGGRTSVDAARPCGWKRTAAYRHVVWIWFENRTYTSVLGHGAAAPNLARYAHRCGVATDYRAITHPSLPNYIAATAGSTDGITSDCDPSSCPVNRDSLYAQVSAAGRRWRGYAESMARNCDRASYDGYAARHNPAVYFTPLAGQCARRDVPMGGAGGPFATALAHNRLPAFAFVTPDLCDDGHDCSTTVADRWAGRWLDRITTSRAYAAGHTVVFVTWDEGVGADNQVATLVIAPSVPPGTRSATRFTHYSLLRTTEQLLGLPFLARAATARSMRRAFRL